MMRHYADHSPLHAPVPPGGGYAVCAGPSRPAPVVITLEQPAATTRNTTRRAQRQRPCIVTAGTVPRARGRCNARWYLLSHAPVGGLVAHDVWRGIPGGTAP